MPSDPGEIQRQIDRYRETAWAELDPELRMFAVTFVMHNFCHIQAAEELGISPNVARRLRSHPFVRAYVSDYVRAVELASMVSDTYIVSKLMEIMPKLEGKEEIEIFVPQMAGSVSAKRFQGAELLRALDMMGKHIGFYNQDDSENAANALASFLRKAMSAAPDSEAIPGQFEEEDVA